MRTLALPRFSLGSALNAALLVLVLVPVGWTVSAGHSKYVFLLAGAGVYAWFAMRSRGGLIGLLVLAAMNGLPFFDTSRTAFSHVTVVDLAALALIGTAIVWILTDGRGVRPTPTARILTRCGLALLIWCIVTIVRSAAPTRSALQFGADFAFFGGLLIVLPRVRLRDADIKAALAVLAIGVCLFSVGQILFVEGIARLSWLVHITGTARTLGLTRVYAPMNDLLSVGVAAGIAAVGLLRNRRAQFIAFAVTALLTTSLIVQLTRARWITLLLSIVLVSVWLASGGERRIAGILRKRVAIFVVAVVGGVAMLMLVAPHAVTGGAVVHRFLSIFTDVGSSNVTTSNVAVRQHVANNMLTVLGGKWLFGLGFIPPTVHFYSTLPTGSIRNTDVGVFNAIMTIGVLGAALIYLPLVITLIRLARAARVQTLEWAWLNYAGQIWLVAALTSSLTLVTLFSKGGVVLSAAVLALLSQERAQSSVSSAPEEIEDAEAIPVVPVGRPRFPAAPAPSPVVAFRGARAGARVARSEAWPDRATRPAPLVRSRQLSEPRRDGPLRSAPSPPPARPADLRSARIRPAALQPIPWPQARPGDQVAPRRWLGARAGGALIATVGAIGAVALGLVVAGGYRPSSPPLAPDHRAVVGSVRFAYPSSWKPAAATTLPGLTLSQGLGLSSPSSPLGQMTLGISTTKAADITATLKSAAGPTRLSVETVSLGSHQFLRLSPLPVSGASVYALPISHGTLVAVCRSTSPSFLGECESVLATVVAPLPPPGPTAAQISYANALSRAMNVLNQARTRLSQRLVHARTQADAARAADGLAKAHLAAAAAVTDLNAGAAAAANTKLATALRRAGDAYTSLARGAAANSSRRYRSAEADVQAANSAIAAALAQLRALGL